ncbi:MAG: hypothetical protein AEth_01351 [Candidatus Argoarchaeum ethanivorans]|uniref:Uncharacterized protein n=1 Tax=Candidatus Argoarchaeum ethanivorans TaxID=2608793 RepID=A0A8B3S0C3_9EURY|nr:MAG: hypothetical protein AEth_01351 [Candidatus Argoarchaeum ethanivorans]
MILLKRQGSINAITKKMFYTQEERNAAKGCLGIYSECGVDEALDYASNRVQKIILDYEVVEPTRFQFF